jgi:hypothetical protein
MWQICFIPLFACSAADDSLTTLCREFKGLKKCGWPAGCEGFSDGERPLCLHHHRIFRYGKCRNLGCEKPTVGEGQKLCLIHGGIPSIVIPVDPPTIRLPSRLPAISEAMVRRAWDPDTEIIPPVPAPVVPPLHLRRRRTVVDETGRRGTLEALVGYDRHIVLTEVKNELAPPEPVSPPRRPRISAFRDP